MPSQWTHRRTWPDYRDSDRVVLRDGLKVGRIYREEFGPRAGCWAWFGWWIGAGNCGAEETLQDALEALRAGALASAIKGQERKRCPTQPGPAK